MTPHLGSSFSQTFFVTFRIACFSSPVKAVAPSANWTTAQKALPLTERKQTPEALNASV
jgi:hypothetical protein